LYSKEQYWGMAVFGNYIYLWAILKTFFFVLLDTFFNKYGLQSSFLDLINKLYGKKAWEGQIQPLINDVIRDISNLLKPDRIPSQAFMYLIFY